MISQDGLARSNGSAVGNSIVAAYNQALQVQSDRQRRWLIRMVGKGAKIVTPDDGWVDRQRNTVSPPDYADLHRCATPGDMIALGTSEKWRLVRCTEAGRNGFSGYPVYAFDPIPVEVGP